MTLLSVIVLSYNTKDLTKKCLISVVDNYKEDIDKSKIEIILADNGSGDGTVEEIKSDKFLEKIKIVENGNNYGFGKGNNLASKKAEGKYILFLNSDTVSKDKGFLEMTLFLEKNTKTGILGGKLENVDGSKQLSAGKFYTPLNLFFSLLGLESFVRSAPDKISRVDWVSGACLMIKKELFEKLKGFDENFFMYIEDMELCYRAKKEGFLTYFYPDIKLEHRQEGSSSRQFAIKNIYKSLLYFQKKHGSKLSFLLTKLMLRLKAKLLVLVGRVMNNKYLTNTYRQVQKI